MSTKIPEGVWPTMITPFTRTDAIDFTALGQLTDWYIEQGVQGLFAVCQSSEMFYLTLEERVSIARFVKERASGRVPVIASGHVSDSFEDQITELKQIAATGVDAVVLVSNRLAGAKEDDRHWVANTEKLLNALPDVNFGIYECPYPYKRLLTPETLRWCAETGRFSFLKDTCCDLQQLKEKLQAISGHDLKLFNANSSTLLASLKMGASGFSGVMANFHPDLYVWLLRNWKNQPEAATRLQSLLTVASLIELQQYPINAKVHLQNVGISLQRLCRVKDEAGFRTNHQMEVQDLQSLSEFMRDYLKI